MKKLGDTGFTKSNISEKTEAIFSDSLLQEMSPHFPRPSQKQQEVWAQSDALDFKIENVKEITLRNEI